MEKETQPGRRGIDLDGLHESMDERFMAISLLTVAQN